MSWNATAVFSETATFDATLDADTTLETGLEQVTQVAATDHAKLTGRDAPDQHPINAITGLEGTLGGKLNGDGALTNFELEAILQS
jgi:hypothetical protein